MTLGLSYTLYIFLIYSVVLSIKFTINLKKLNYQNDSLGSNQKGKKMEIRIQM